MDTIIKEVCDYENRARDNFATGAMFCTVIIAAAAWPRATK
jgi:hypothetical protein